MYSASPINPEQLELIAKNTETAKASGLYGRYEKILKNNQAVHERSAAEENDPLLASAFALAAGGIAELLKDDLPLYFVLEPSNMSASVCVAKIDPIKVEVVPHSRVQVGLIGGLSGDEGTPSRQFACGDLPFAVGAVKEQVDAGLTIELAGHNRSLLNYLPNN